MDELLIALGPTPLKIRTVAVLRDQIVERSAGLHLEYELKRGAVILIGQPQVKYPPYTQTPCQHRSSFAWAGALTAAL